MKKVINVSSAPKPVGPYSQAIRVGDLLFLSGTIPLDPVSMTIDGTDIASQTTRVFSNIKAVLESEGMTLKNIVKTTCFLKDLNDGPIFNKIYEEQFGDYLPARSTIEVSRIPKDVLVEIEVIAHI